jgi:hypothetical protein
VGSDLGNDDAKGELVPIFASSDYASEVVYSDLLQRLLVYIKNLRAATGWWREHVKLLDNLYEVLHKFYMPEVH